MSHTRYVYHFFFFRDQQAVEKNRNAVYIHRTLLLVSSYLSEMAFVGQKIYKHIAVLYMNHFMFNLLNFSNSQLIYGVNMLSLAGV